MKKIKYLIILLLLLILGSGCNKQYRDSKIKDNIELLFPNAQVIQHPLNDSQHYIVIDSLGIIWFIEPLSYLLVCDISVVYVDRIKDQDLYIWMDKENGEYHFCYRQDINKGDSIIAYEKK